MSSNEAVRQSTTKKPLFVLNAIVFFMSFGFYILYPLLANQLISWQGVNVLTVTFVLSARIVTQDLLMLPAGMVLNRLGSRQAITLGGIIRGVGFLLFTLSKQTAPLLFASVLTGIGGALFFPSAHALYTSLSEPETRVSIFAKRERLNSLGAVLGPLCGTALLNVSFFCVGLVAFFVFLIASIALMIYMPVHKGNFDGRQDAPMRLSQILRDKRFLVFSCVSMLIMQCTNQVSIALAVRINQVQPDYAYIGLISSLSSVLMVLFQVGLIRLLYMRFSLPQVLGLSVLFFMLGFAVLGFVDSIIGMYIGVIITCIGTMLYMPTRDTMLSQYANGQPTGALYGFQGITNTFGNLVLASGIGVLYDLSVKPMYRFAPWGALFLCGAITIVMLRILTRMKCANAAPCITKGENL